MRVLMKSTESGYLVERRLKPRFECNYPARIRGQDGNGKLFEEIGKAVNLSRTGVYIILNREIPKGTDILIKIAMPTGLLNLGTPKLALRGKVVRGELHAERNYEIAVKFDEYRFV